MNLAKIIGVFAILLVFAITLGTLMGYLFEVPYGNIAVVSITGEILSNGGSLLSESVNSQEIVNQLKDINANALIQAVILDINSPGGASVASAEIVNAVKKLNKPVVALIRDVGASGAYWVASAADYIIAHELSLTGSLGVQMTYLEYSGLLERYNVSYVNLSYPEHKDILSQYRPLSDLEQSWVESWLETAYDYLVTDIALNRNMTKQELLPYANGSVFMGYEAMQYGLIDGLGGWDEALNKTIELGNISEAILLEYEEAINILDILSGIYGRQDLSLRT